MVPAVPRPDRIERWSADLYESYLPVWTFAYAGPWLVPRWNPFQLAGSPLLASVTGAHAYPLNLLATIVPVPIALGWACALHVALAGVLMFLCGRAAGLSRAAATLAAIGFMLSERVLIERIHPPYLFGVAWLPAVFLAAGRVGSEPGAWRGAVLGTAVACLLLAGYPELVCFTAYSLLLLLLVLLVIRGVPAWSDLRRLMVAGLAAGATACALGAVQLLPTLELAGWLPAARGGGRRAGSHVAAGFRARRRARARRGRGGRAGVRYLAGERSGAGAPRRERSLLARLECHRGR